MLNLFTIKNPFHNKKPFSLLDCELHRELGIQLQIFCYDFRPSNFPESIYVCQVLCLKYI